MFHVCAFMGGPTTSLRFSKTVSCTLHALLHIHFEILQVILGQTPISIQLPHVIQYIKTGFGCAQCKEKMFRVNIYVCMYRYQAGYFVIFSFQKYMCMRMMCCVCYYAHFSEMFMNWCTYGHNCLYCRAFTSHLCMFVCICGCFYIHCLLFLHSNVLQ